MHIIIAKIATLCLIQYVKTDVLHPPRDPWPEVFQCVCMAQIQFNTEK